MRTFAATSPLATLSCSSPRSSLPYLACCSLRDTAPPLSTALTWASTCSTAISLSPCTSAAPAPFSVPSSCYTSCLAHTPPSPARCSHSGKGHTCPGPTWGTSSTLHPLFLWQPEHTLLPHRGRVCCRCHGLLLSHDPGPRAVAERLLQALHTAPLQICVPSPALHVEVFGVTRSNPGTVSHAGVLHGTAITKTPSLLRIPIAPPVSGFPYIGLGSFRWSSPGARITKSDLIISPSEYGPQFSFSAKMLWRYTPPPPHHTVAQRVRLPPWRQIVGLGGVRLPPV